MGAVGKVTTSVFLSFLLCLSCNGGYSNKHDCGAPTLYVIFCRCSADAIRKATNRKGESKLNMLVVICLKFNIGEGGTIFVPLSSNLDRFNVW